MAYAASKSVSGIACTGETNVRMATHSHTGGFCFREMCFFCGESCTDSNDLRKVQSGTDFDNKIRHDATLHPHCMILPSETAASVDDVCLSGIRLMAGLYGTKNAESLTALRYTAFCNTSVSRRFTAERLPPSESTCRL